MSTVSNSLPISAQVTHGGINGQRSRKSRGRPKNRDTSFKEASSLEQVANRETNGNTDRSTESEDSVTCWICAEPVKFYSIAECNHRTCHVCALRLRALYKRMDCTFCKHPQATLIFTRSPADLFESYTPEMIPFKDTKLSIFFETQDMMEETLILLRFNCPDPSCDFTAQGWGDLKMHVRAIHGRSMCDMCIRYKKVFAHEHVLYQPSQLPFHLPSIPHRISPATEKVESGVHPMCEFCRECYFGDDELFAHMRERHEECFLCKRDGIRDQYFKDYNGLERHFDVKHFPCKDVQCQAQKFVVFGSTLDLKAHMVEQHGGEMTARDRKDARRIETGFDYDDIGESNRRQERARARERERDPPEPGPSRSRRRETFGANLTSQSLGVSGPPQSTLQRQQEEEENPHNSDIDPVAAERHAAFIARVNLLTSNSTSALPAIKAAIRSYRSSESGPRDLISTIYNVVNLDLDATASLISSLVELLDDEDKRRALLAAWNGFKLEHQREFPDLNATAVGSEYAGVAGGRVLNIKHSAAVRSSTQSPRQVWDRVAQAAASSSFPPPPTPTIRPHDRFPTLAVSKTTPAFRQTQHTTAWSASSSSSSSRPTSDSFGPRPVVASTSRAIPQISATLFPTLPSSGSSNTYSRLAVSGNQSLKHILGDVNTPPSNPWGSKKSEDPQANITPPATQNDVNTQPEAGSVKAKKKKGKEKQTLFTFGTFPS
ncbi:hypothetical protein K439DRAFT_1633855 [Ramaria rubella]|nr:hypothetical protein K439DRAFT_1633855 [Ramaria rubella]